MESNNKSHGPSGSKDHGSYVDNYLNVQISCHLKILQMKFKINTKGQTK